MMKRQLTGLIVVIGGLAAAGSLLLWPDAGLIHSGPIVLLGVGLLAGALMKFARATQPASRG